MAIAKGMRTLLDDGIRAAREGITTIDEILRVARA
jgi:type II secretory ATPase GspE/PulE/Tfp pilus assembly ATPase PilB-like protein